MDLHRREGTERGERAERRKSERSMATALYSEYASASRVRVSRTLREGRCLHAVMWPPSGPATRDTNVAGRRAWPRRTGRGPPGGRSGPSEGGGARAGGYILLASYWLAVYVYA